MKYLLDTNVCIQYLNERSKSLTERLDSTPTSDIAVSAVVKAELYYGATKSNYGVKTLTRQERFLEEFTSLPFDDAAARVYGEIRTRLERAGTPIGAMDLLIAAIALANSLILVTHNTREFGRIAGLQVEDWQQ
jgi:tRNA(fMet)-specific endonuclease VapC